MVQRSGIRPIWKLTAVALLVAGAACNSGSPPPKSEPSKAVVAPEKPLSEPISVMEKIAESPATTTTSETSAEPATTEEPVAANAVNVVTDPVPLDLTKYYQMPAANFVTAKRYPWKIVPQGTQKFANIPVEIGGAMFLWGEQNTKNGLVYPEQIEGIPVNKTFETLYIYHSAFYEGQPGDAVYDVVFQYEDGTSAKDTITNGIDVLDWYLNTPDAPKEPSGPRSTLAWSGSDEAGQVVRYCLTAVPNPHPTSKVKSLDLISAKTRTAGCILGLTIGKSGLLKMADKEASRAE